MHGSQVPKLFWDEAVSTACYIINRVYVRKGTDKTPYELWKRKSAAVGYFHVFGCVCYIFNDKDNLGKFDAKSKEELFLGYSGHITAFRVYNKQARVVQESMNVVFCEASVHMSTLIPLQESSKPIPDVSKSVETDTESELSEKEKDQRSEEITSNIQVHKNHSLEDIIGEVQGGRVTRGKTQDYKKLAGRRQYNQNAAIPQEAGVVQFACFVSVIEPKIIWKRLLMSSR